MMPSKQLSSIILLYIVQLAAHALAGTRFASHVSVNTPARSFTHGVGDPLPFVGRRTQNNFKNARRPPIPARSRGYPRVMPSIPFNVEEAPRNVPSTASLWHNNMEIEIPLLPASPYKVDSPDPESLWPEGLFLPPFNSRFTNLRRSDNDLDAQDPYLLEGSEAIAAVIRAKKHGELYFHDIPHIESLFANQELRIQNHLNPHIIGSIRHTWPYNRN